MISLSPLLTTHKFHLACLNCHSIVTNEIVLLPHHCQRNVVVCHDNSKKQWQWQRVRARPTTNLRPNLTQFPICRDFPRCPRSVRCTSAHSELERWIWNKELKEKIVLIPENVVDYLSHSCVVESFRQISLDEIGPVYVWIGCQRCTTVVMKGYCQVLKYRHVCDADTVLFRSVSWKHYFWVIVRPRTAETSSSHELCRHVEKNDCWDWKTCRFAHSDLEFRLWALDEGKKSFYLTELLDNELENWHQNEPTYRIVVPKPIPKLAAPTPMRPLFAESFPNSNSTNGSGPFLRRGSSLTAAATNKQIVSPFKVHYICGVCFLRNSSIVYQRSGSSSKCDNKKEPHEWNVHKMLAIFDGTGRAFKLRPLPFNLVFKKAKSTTMCKLITEGKICYRSVCDFAHSDAEKRCWTFLLRQGISGEVL